MSRKELVAMVVAQIHAVLPLGGRAVQESDILRELPEVDSLKLVRVAAGLERCAGIQFNDNDLFGATTVGELVDALAAAIASRQPHAPPAVSRTSPTRNAPSSSPRREEGVLMEENSASHRPRV